MEPQSPKNGTQAGTVITVDLPLCQIPQTTVLMLPIYFAANPANRPPHVPRSEVALGNVCLIRGTGGTSESSYTPCRAGILGLIRSLAVLGVSYTLCM